MPVEKGIFGKKREEIKRCDGGKEVGRLLPRMVTECVCT